MKRYLAFDLGAESGRAMLGSLDGGSLSLEELHRFPNTPVRILSSLHWDALRLFHEICQGLAVAGRDFQMLRRNRVDQRHRLGLGGEVDRCLSG